MFHAAGPSTGGWTIMAAHDSKESWERFRDNILMPRMQLGLEGGFRRLRKRRPWTCTSCNSSLWLKEPSSIKGAKRHVVMSGKPVR